MKHRADDRDFVDALRGMLRMRPLYRQDETPSYERWSNGLMSRAIGDGNRRTRSSHWSDSKEGASSSAQLARRVRS